ncbi:MAG TPA: hypothetical protein VFW96_12420, partial [Thermomicrobiales bacterium]|nr:hypothetical protein [Thermomicrobiales bacterium]
MSAPTPETPETPKTPKTRLGAGRLGAGPLGAGAPAGPDGESRLDACGCCDAGLPRPAIFNRPGQPALAYRADTQPTALRRMLAALPRQGVGDDGARPLRALTTRAADDPAVALLDAWATVTDVLTFYQERIANEGYLRTATERGSVLELARAIGYELNPGVAASAFLAFTVEDAPGAPGAAAVPVGVRVQSIPGQGQLPQTFETVEPLDARAAWNALRPRRAAAQRVRQGDTALYLRGVTTLLQPGDAILLCGDERAGDPFSERWDFRVLTAVTARPPDPREPDDPGYTLVEWAAPLGSDVPPALPAARPRAFALRQRAALFGHNAPDFRAMADSVKRSYHPDYDPQNPGAVAEWPDFVNRTAREGLLDLDAVYPKLLPGGWVVLGRAGYRELYRVEDATTTARADFTLTAKVTRLRLDSNQRLAFYQLRDTVVYAQSEELPLADLPLTDPVLGDEIVFDRLAPGLARGQALVVRGRPSRVRLSQAASWGVAAGAAGLILRAADGSGRATPLAPGDLLRVLGPPDPAAPGVPVWRLRDRDGFAGTLAAPRGALEPAPAAPDDPFAGEVAFIADAPDAIREDRDRTTIALRAPLAGSYDRATVTVNANVARATHGETVRETLGGGDGAAANQRFTLTRPPLTYVTAPTASGARSTLAVRVNGALWGEAPSLFGLAPRDQCYAVRIGGDGRTDVVFGDGVMGARPPTGVEN